MATNHSELKSPFVIDKKSEGTTYNSMMNSILGKYITDGNGHGGVKVESVKDDTDIRPRRGRPRKDSSSKVIDVDMSESDKAHSSNTVNYHAAYNETDNILKTAIYQTDEVISEVSNDLHKIRESKAMTSKYKYITDLSSTMSSLISTKINAARELNNSIARANDLEYKMQKELKALEGVKDDNKSIMDMYNAFMSVPVGTYSPMAAAPSIQDITLPNSSSNMNSININATDGDAGYQNYINNITPEQNRMRYENNPNVQTVVVYDQSNGRKWFDVIDITTGQSVPNVAKPDEFLLEDTRPDIVNGVARNNNINVTYPLKVVGDRSLSDY